MTSPADIEGMIARDLSILISNVLDFEDPAIINQVIQLSGLDPAYLPNCLILGSNRNLELFIKNVLEIYNCADMKFQEKIREFKHSPVQSAWLRSVQTASLFDGLFSAVEGNVDFIFEGGESYSSLYDRVIDASKQSLKKPKRFTPFGQLTDDSQFLAAGILAQFHGRNNFAHEYINEWRRFNAEELWRNPGLRMKGYLTGNDQVFRGDPTLGDLLRAVPFSVLFDELPLMEEQLKLFSTKLKLTQRQHEFCLDFLKLYLSFLEKDQQACGIYFKRLSTSLGSNGEFLRYFLSSVHDELLSKGNFLGYMRSMYAFTSDYDTVGFIGGLFVPQLLLEIWEQLPVKRDNLHFTRLMIASSLPQLSTEIRSLVRGLFFEEERNERDLLKFLRDQNNEVSLVENLKALRVYDPKQFNSLQEQLRDKWMKMLSGDEDK